MATRKKFEGVDEKDQRTDVEEPEGGQGQAESQAELQKGGAQKGGNAVA